MRLFRFALLLGTLAFSASGRAVDAAADAPAERARIPVLAWGGPPADQATVERFREMVECGFTHNFSGFSDNDQMARALDVARTAGIKLLLSTPQLSSDPAGTAGRFKDHPAVGGYFLRDEPGAKAFDELGAWCRKIQAADSGHPCYVNLFPNYATPGQLEANDYQAYLDAFVKTVPTPMLSFDHYPVVGDTLRGEWYENLERAAATARRADRPLWAFVLSVAHGPYPVPTIAHLRVQAFSDLAYGAQAIQYFTYWTSKSSEWNFNNGPIDTEGKRTEVYGRVKQVNQEIQALAPVFVGSTVISVGHTGDAVPAGTKRYVPAAPMTAVETEGTGAVVSLLKNGGRQFLVVVNRDINRPMPLRVRWKDAAKVERVLISGARVAINEPQLREQVDPGCVVVLSWEARE